jgi:hypothetical protein
MSTMAESEYVVDGGQPTLLRSPGTWILLLLYTAANIWAWTGTEPVLTWDSGRYTSGDIFLFLNPGIPSTALFSVVTDSSLATLIQVLIYVAAWISLTLAILRSLQGTWTRWPLAILALLVSLTSPLWAWNLVIGSEGLTVSAVVLWMSTMVWLAGGDRAVTWVLSTTSASALLVTRPQTVIFVVPIQIVASIWWARRNGYRLRDLRGALVISLVVLMAGVGWSVYRSALLANDDVYSFRYALHNLVEKTPSFRQYVLNEAPPCEAIPAALNGPQPWTDVIAFDNTLIGLCPETFIWFKSNAVSPQSWVLYDPVAATLNFRDVMWGIALPVGSETSILPMEVDDALLPVHNVWLATAVALAIGLILGLVGRVRYHVSLRVIAGLVVVIGSVTLYLFAVWAADGYDVIRHMVPITTLLPIAALVLPTAMTGKRPDSTRR